MKKEEIKDKSIDLLFKIYEAGVEHKTVDLSYELRKLQSLTEQEQPKQSVEEFLKSKNIDLEQIILNDNEFVDLKYYKLSDLLKEYTQTQSTVSEWISVEDRLPEPLSKCLIYIEEQDFIANGGLEEDGSWTEQYIGEKVNTVTHWQPLPQPPKQTK